MEEQVPSFNWNEILAPWVEESTEPRPNTSVDTQGQQLHVTNVLDLDDDDDDDDELEFNDASTLLGH